MTANISPIGNTQFVDANGNPLVGGKVYTYAAGTTTQIDAYTTHVGDVPQSNPAILNSLGALDDPLYLDQSVGYKIVVKDADDVATGMEYDYVYGSEEATAPSEWILYTGEYSYLSSTQFSVVGDQTQVFQTNRHLKTLVTAGTAYHIVSSASYSAPDTTVTVTNTFLSLDTGLNQLYYGFFAPDNSSIPESAIGTAIRTATSQAAAQAALDVYSTTEVDDAIADAVGAIPSPQSFRNVLLNGGMSISQEFGTSSTTITAGAALKYVVDGWYVACTGANVTAQQVITNNKASLVITGAASNATVIIGTRVESADSYSMAGLFATLSLLISSSTLTSISWGLYYASTKDSFGTIASPTRTTIDTGTLTGITSTEALKSAITAAALSTSAHTGLELVFTTGALLGSQTLTITYAQLEKGSVTAPVFENTSVDRQLARCQRLYYKYKGNLRAYATVSSGTQREANFMFPVEMRVSPTITYGTWASGWSTGPTTTITTQSFSAYGDVASDAHGQAISSNGFVANARL